MSPLCLVPVDAVAVDPPPPTISPFCWVTPEMRGYESLRRGEEAAYGGHVAKLREILRNR
jgi:hypothetical protein